MQRIKGILNVVRAAITTHAANEQLIAVGVVRFVGIGHHDPFNFFATRAIAAAAFAARRCDNAAQSKEHTDGNYGQYDDIRRVKQIFHALPFPRSSFRDTRVRCHHPTPSSCQFNQIVSYFLLFTGMKIYNTFWVYIIPSLFGGFYNVIIYNANFREIPASLVESAKLDGASEYSIFFKIFMPLSKPVLSALAIFTAVGTWNDYTQTLYYTRSTDLQTLSYYMLTIIKSSQTAENMSKMGTAASSVLSTMSEQASNYKTIELACMVLSSIPLIVMYPFAQKFFEKGLMVGSVKG